MGVAFFSPSATRLLHTPAPPPTPFPAHAKGMTDREISTAAQAAHHPEAPPDERYDARAQVGKAVAGSVPRLDAQALIKAATFLHRVNLRLAERQGWPRSGQHDPYGIFRHSGYLQRPAPIGFAQLRALVEHDPVLYAIILTRARQVSRLARPARYDHEPGFRLRLRGASELTAVDQKRLEWLERFLLNSGAEFDPFRREALRRDDLITYLKKAVMDSLTMDAMPVEIIRTPSGRVHGWVHVDGATVYLAPPEGLPKGTPPPPGCEGMDPEDVKAVEAQDGRVVNWFARDELLYRVRNPRPDVWGQGYGIAEPELMIRIITGFLNVITYNLKSYEDNHIPQGFLTLFGDFREEDIEEFKAEWAAYVAGVSNAWRLPVLISRDREAGAQFTATGVNPSEMHFVKWTSFLVAIQCALYGIDPEEIGFESFSSRTSTLNEASIESKLVSSRDKGLYPLLQHLEATFNTLLSAVDPEVEFYWTGFQDPREVWERDRLALTYGELRQRLGLPTGRYPLLEDAPLNPSLLTVYLEAARPNAAAGPEGPEPTEDHPWPPDEEGAEALAHLAQALKETHA